MQQGGRHVQFAGDGLLALFEEDGASGPGGAARRAVAAGLGIALAAHAFRPWLEQRFADRGLPPFAVGIGVHSGEVTLWRDEGLQPLLEG